MRPADRHVRDAAALDRVDVAGEQVAHVGGMEGSADGRDRLDCRQLRGGAQYRRAAEAMTDEQRGSDICST